MRDDGLTHQEAARQLDFEHLAPQLLGQLGQRHPVRSPGGGGIIDQDIDPTQGRERLFDRPLDIGAVGDIGDQRQAALAPLADLIGHAVNIAPADRLLVVRVAGRVTTGAGHHQVGAQLGQGHGGRPANAAQAPGAGDNCDFSIQYAHTLLTQSG